MVDIIYMVDHIGKLGISEPIPAEQLYPETLPESRVHVIALDRDADYPRFGNEYFRRRWHWELGDINGDAAFAITALIAAQLKSRF